MLAARDAGVRSELRGMLESAAGLEVVAEAGDTEAAVEAVARHRPAALLLDLDRPGDIAYSTPSAACDRPPPEHGSSCSRRRTTCISFATRYRPARRTVFSVTCPARISSRRFAAAAPDGTRDDLTQREFDVLRLLALGHTNAEVAAQLHLSVRTVEAHRARLQQKLSRPSRAELVRYAIERGLLQPTEDPARG